MAYFHQFSPARGGKFGTQATPGGGQRGADLANTGAPGAPGDASSGKARIVKIDNMVNNDSSTFQVECGTGKYLQASLSQNDEILRFWEGDQAGKTSDRKFSTKDETHFLSSIRWRPQVVRAPHVKAVAALSGG